MYYMTIDHLPQVPLGPQPPLEPTQTNMIVHNIINVRFHILHMLPIIHFMPKTCIINGSNVFRAQQQDVSDWAIVDNGHILI
jgi:hypothetical protein